MNLFDVVSADSLKQAQKRLIYDGKTDTERFGLNLCRVLSAFPLYGGQLCSLNFFCLFADVFFFCGVFFGTFEMPVIFIIICNVLPVHIF